MGLEETPLPEREGGLPGWAPGWEIINAALPLSAEVIFSIIKMDGSNNPAGPNPSPSTGHLQGGSFCALGFSEHQAH